jgi:hypothetical protein
MIKTEMEILQEILKEIEHIEELKYATRQRWFNIYPGDDSVFHLKDLTRSMVRNQIERVKAKLYDKMMGDTDD